MTEIFSLTFFGNKKRKKHKWNLENGKKEKKMKAGMKFSKRQKRTEKKKNEVVEENLK